MATYVDLALVFVLDLICHYFPQPIPTWPPHPHPLNLPSSFQTEVALDYSDQGHLAIHTTDKGDDALFNHYF